MGCPGRRTARVRPPGSRWRPTWTVAEEWPASIWPAMEAARLTGIAKPWVAPDWDWNWNVVEAAVSRPITRPAGDGRLGAIGFCTTGFALLMSASHGLWGNGRPAARGHRRAGPEVAPGQDRSGMMTQGGLFTADKSTSIRRVKMNGGPPTGRIGLTRLSTHQRTGHLACILPLAFPARTLRTCAS